MTAPAIAAVGLFAIVAAYVRQRRREIAIRLALGATRAGVTRLVLAQVILLAGLGVLFGSVGSVAGGRLLHSVLFELTPLDPPVIIGTAFLLVAASALASYSPLRRPRASILRRPSAPFDPPDSTDDVHGAESVENRLGPYRSAVAVNVTVRTEGRLRDSAPGLRH